MLIIKHQMCNVTHSSARIPETNLKLQNRFQPEKAAWEDKDETGHRRSGKLLYTGID